MEFSGVRNSWLTFAKNSLFSLLDSPSPTFASESSPIFKSSAWFIPESCRCTRSLASSMRFKLSANDSTSSRLRTCTRALCSPRLTRSAVSCNCRSGESTSRRNTSHSKVMPVATTKLPPTINNQRISNRSSSADSTADASALTLALGSVPALGSALALVRPMALASSMRRSTISHAPVTTIEVTTAVPMPKTINARAASEPILRAMAGMIGSTIHAQTRMQRRPCGDDRRAVRLLHAGVDRSTPHGGRPPRQLYLRRLLGGRVPRLGDGGVGHSGDPLQVRPLSGDALGTIVAHAACARRPADWRGHSARMPALRSAIGGGVAKSH